MGMSVDAISAVGGSAVLVKGGYTFVIVSPVKVQCRVLLEEVEGFESYLEVLSRHPAQGERSVVFR